MALSADQQVLKEEDQFAYILWQTKNKMNRKNMLRKANLNLNLTEWVFMGTCFSIFITISTGKTIYRIQKTILGCQWPKLHKLRPKHAVKAVRISASEHHFGQAENLILKGEERIPLGRRGTGKVALINLCPSSSAFCYMTQCISAPLTVKPKGLHSRARAHWMGIGIKKWIKTTALTNPGNVVKRRKIVDVTHCSLLGAVAQCR